MERVTQMISVPIPHSSQWDGVIDPQSLDFEVDKLSSGAWDWPPGRIKKAIEIATQNRFWGDVQRLLEDPVEDPS